MVNLNLFFILNITIFTIGIFGIMFNSISVIFVLLSIELILLAVNLNFLYFSILLDDFFGQLFSLFILTVAASESAIGLAILIIFFKVKNTITTKSIGLLHGL